MIDMLRLGYREEKREERESETQSGYRTKSLKKVDSVVRRKVTSIFEKAQKQREVNCKKEEVHERDGDGIRVNGVNSRL